MMIPFNRPFMTGKELWYIAQAHAKGHLAGDGSFSRQCAAWLQTRTGAHRAMLTHSCTAALEMAAMLADVKPGDEVIMPSYTFVSTANAFVLRGAVPVFVDIRPDTLNIDEIADRSRDHRRDAGDRAGSLCRRRLRDGRDHGDRRAARPAGDRGRGAGVMATLQGPPARLDRRPWPRCRFHETKNIISGEGGALLVQRSALCRAGRDHPREGHEPQRSSFAARSTSTPGSTSARRTCRARSSRRSCGRRWKRPTTITHRRLALWDTLPRWLAEPETAGKLRRPIVPSHCGHNAHMYYLLLPDLEPPHRIHRQAARRGHQHRLPLHPAAQRAGGKALRTSARHDEGHRRNDRSPGAASDVVGSGRAPDRS